MVDILPESQLVIGHGAFSVVYKARLKSVSFSLFSFVVFVPTLMSTGLMVEMKSRSKINCIAAFNNNNSSHEIFLLED